MNVLRPLLTVCVLGIAGCSLTFETIYYREAGVQDAQSDGHHQDAAADSDAIVDAIVDAGHDAFAEDAPPDASDVSDAPDATDSAVDAGPTDTPPTTRGPWTVTIQELNNDIRTGMISDFYIRRTYPTGFGTDTGWERFHCSGGVLPVPGMPMRVQCVLDITSFVSGERIDFYPIKASDANPVCGACGAGDTCPSAYPSDFTVIIDPSIATYTMSSHPGLSASLACTSVAMGASTTVMSFIVP